MTDETAPTIQEYFSLKQAATMTGMSTKHITRAIKAGELVCSNMSKGGARPTYRIHRSAIDTWMKSFEPNMGPSREQVSDLEAKYFPKSVRA